MAKIDNFTKEQLEQIVFESTSMREVCKKIGYTSNGSNYLTVQSRLNKYNISTDHFTGLSKGVVKRTPENIFIENSTASQHTLRRWYLKGEYTEYKCAICGQLPFWNNKELTLTLDHINGNNHDDRLENLRWVCPNCDRQLDTFGAKNPTKKINYNAIIEKNYCIDCGKEISPGAERCQQCYGIFKREVERPSREELKQLIRTMSFVSIGKMYNVSDNAIRRWCKSYNLPFSVKEIKQFSNDDWEKV